MGRTIDDLLGKKHYVNYAIIEWSWSGSWTSNHPQNNAKGIPK